MNRTPHTAQSPVARAEFVQKLVRNGENEHVEFKSTLRWNINKEKIDLGVELAWLKTLVAFLNSNGGTLIVGVDDAGHVVGHERDNFDNDDKYLLHVNNRIQQNIGLEYAPCIRYALEPFQGGLILVIECSPSSEPVFLRHGKDESFFIRIGPGTRKLTTSQVLAYMSERRKRPPAG
jgi:predicted HTH transcriptional regulator